MKESPLSHVKVTLREDGNIAITYSSVPVSGIDSLFQKDYPDYLDYLEHKQAPLEYIDSLETEGFMISKDIYSIDSIDNYTHCEIHSSLILSAVALNIPFPEHSQYPRNV